MSKNIFTYIVLAVLIVISIIGFISMTQLNSSNVVIGDNPGTFPQLVCIFIIIFSAASIIQTIKTKDIKFKIPNLIMVLITVMACIIFIALWSIFDIFYIAAALFIFSLFWLYSEDRMDYKRLLKVGLPITFGTIICIYLFFEKAMALRL